MAWHTYAQQQHKIQVGQDATDTSVHIYSMRP
jgi:hypothetical protein